MAFQQQGMVGNGGHGAHADQQPPQPAEYTLQGVMRFLQIEWHNHERARNAWDIERAEMKAKIAKQEGECRQAKRISEQLDRQVRMLEKALKAERAKKQGSTPESINDKNHGATPDIGQESVKDERATEATRKEDSSGSSLPQGQAPRQVHHNSFLHVEEPPEAIEKERDQHMYNTSRYLKNCMKEIQYLLTPPQHPPPPQLLPNGHFTGLPEAPLSVEDIYARHQQQRAHQRLSNHGLSPSTMPNHQPPPLPNVLPPTSGPQHDTRSNQYDYTATPQAPVPTADPSNGTLDESVETIVHSFDTRGQPTSEGDAQPLPAHAVPEIADSEGWQFDEDSAMQADAPPTGPVPHRPDTDLFPSAQHSMTHLSAKSPPRAPGSHRRKSSGSQAMARRRSSQGKQETHDGADSTALNDPSLFKVKFALRGHLDVVRSVIFSGGGSPSEPEVCTAGDDGTIKRWIIPATYHNFNSGNSADLDIPAYFTHRGHDGVVTSLATCPATTGFSTGGRASGDGWIFSGGQDATVRVWERGRVDPKATLEGHTDAVWTVCVLPASVGHVFGPQSNNYGGPDNLLVVSGSADGSVKVWAVSAPPQASSPSSGSRRGVGGSRRHSVTSGSNYPTSPQPSVASSTPFRYSLIHTIERASTGNQKPSPTCISPLSLSAETFVVSYTDSSVLIFNTRTGEEVIGMASGETYDGTMDTSINTVSATSLGPDSAATGGSDSSRGLVGDEVGVGASGSRDGAEGVVISGHEDRYVRFFDGNSGQCTYNMLAHPSAISSLCLSRDGREAVSGGHDASIRFWSLEKRICTQDIVSHRAMRGEGVCSVCWSQDGRLVVSAGGDGVAKVFAR